MNKREAQKSFNIALQNMARIEFENKNFTYNWIWVEYDKQRIVAQKILETKKK